jgi:AcrR family transcriptional regulator
MESMLICCGEVGYRRVSVERVFRHYGGYRSHFYRHFSDKADCFAAAYEDESERLCRRMLSVITGSEGGEARIGVALSNLADFVSAQPAVAKSLFLEVHVAGGPALKKRREVVERLAVAVDEACRPAASGTSPPPTTGAFIIGAIEEATSNALAKGQPDELTALIPELTEIVRHVYSG